MPAARDRLRRCREALVVDELKRAQLVDDEKGVTIMQVGSVGKGFSAGADGKGKRPAKSAVARAIGELLAEKAKEKGVTKVVFDRKGYRYHGRVKALADAARGKGLVF